MAEAIRCRIKFAFMLLLFALPMGLTLWNRHLDLVIEQARYLPAPASMDTTDFLVDEFDSPIAEVADISDPLEIEIP